MLSQPPVPVTRYITQMTASRRRRRKHRLPHWYTPLREDPASLPPEGDVERQLQEYQARQKSVPLRGARAVKAGSPAVEPPEFAMAPLMMPKTERFDASWLHTVSRFLRWTLGILGFYVGILTDKLLRRDSEQRRAARLLRTIQRIGGTLVKLGQQLAMRADLLPYAYCVELSRLLDRMPSFPLEEAVAAIRRATGRELGEVFARFDPEPIGSASMACVYKAVLRTGEQVAVKVRRPGIGRVFAADLRAFDWLIGIVEWLSIIRPGNLRNLVRELEISFMEELDFRREAYCQEVFRRSAQDRKLTRRFYFSAPQVFFTYSNHEVIVQDFIEGMFLSDVLAAVEQGKPDALAKMRALNIDPKIVGRRILWISLWSRLCNVMFHADPHPANIVVQANSRIIFIDFGACGYVSSEKRNRFQEFFRCQGLKDVSGMVKATMALLEPLPRIDLDAFEKALERRYFTVLAAMWSQQAPWWERTSATMWLSLLQLTREYGLPVNSDTVKGLRATLLYDTLGLRLDHDIDILKECQRFVRDALHLTGQQVRKRIRKRMGGGLQLEDFAKLDELARLGNNAIEQVKRLVDHPPFNFGASVAKPAYAVITGFKVAVFLGELLLAATGVLTVWLLIAGQPAAISQSILKVLNSHAFQVTSCLAVLVGLRRVMFRLNDRDP